jgi:hypothetical protein
MNFEEAKQALFEMAPNATGKSIKYEICQYGEVIMVRCGLWVDGYGLHESETWRGALDGLAVAMGKREPDPAPVAEDGR